MEKTWLSGSIRVQGGDMKMGMVKLRVALVTSVAVEAEAECHVIATAVPRDRYSSAKFTFVPLCPHFTLCSASCC